MRITLQTKDCVRLGIMKGCVCIVRHIVFAEGEALPDDCGTDNVIHLRYMPVALWLQACDAFWTADESLLPKDMPTTTSRVGLFHLRPTYKYLTTTWEEVSFKVRRTSFEVMPSDTIIVYGAQGGTFDAVIADMKKPPNMDADTHW